MTYGSLFQDWPPGQNALPDSAVTDHPQTLRQLVEIQQRLTDHLSVLQLGLTHLPWSCLHMSCLSLKLQQNLSQNLCPVGGQLWLQLHLTLVAR